MDPALRRTACIPPVLTCETRARHRLGTYEVVCANGAGGMGEVYRAMDMKLKRQVTIRILPPLVAADTDGSCAFSAKPKCWRR
jgi:hypothetical protein